MATVRQPPEADQIGRPHEPAGEVELAAQNGHLADGIAPNGIAPDSVTPDGLATNGLAPDLPLPALVAPPPPQKPKITQETIDARFENLLRQVQANRPSEDVSLIRKAWEFCVQHHAGQERASGEPYIIHPLEVAEVLAEMKMDASAIAAGLLHDSVEDTPATSAEIAQHFGDQVAHIVEGVTKI